LSEATLRTERLCLEPLAPGHAVELFDGLTDPRLYEFVDDEPPPSVGWLQERYRKLASGKSPDGSDLWCSWAVRRLRNGRAIGFVQATIDREQVATTAYVLFPGAWGRGFGREAVAAMMTELSGRDRVTAFRATTHPQNRRSIVLLSALGFERAETQPAAQQYSDSGARDWGFVRLPSPLFRL
jgi:[ribosomal protein S5]-alanine N-acetyltransferase